MSSSLNCGKMAALEQLLQAWHDERDSKVRPSALSCEVIDCKHHPSACMHVSCSASSSSCRRLCVKVRQRTVMSCQACWVITCGSSFVS